MSGEHQLGLTQCMSLLKLLIARTDTKQQIAQAAPSVCCFS